MVCSWVVLLQLPSDLNLWSLSFPLYKMGIIIMATSQRFEDENNTTYVKH